MRKIMLVYMLLISSVLYAGTCASPDGPTKQISSPPADHQQLVDQGYCTYSYPTTSSVVGYYTFVSPGTAVNLNAGYAASCVNITFGSFALYDASCNLVGTGLSYSGLTPGATYKWTVTMRAFGGPSCTGFTAFCPYYVNVTPLPMVLIRFDAKRYGNETRFEWEVESQVNVERYIIEESYDAKSFKVLLEEAVRDQDRVYGVSRYSNDVGSDWCYYRLVSRDIDGLLTSSPVIAVRYINKATVSDVLYDMNGRRVDVTGILPRGIYFDDKGRIVIR
jgi:hypothetical protein